MDSFGKKLRECREAKGISQSALVRPLDTHHSLIGKYERDEVKPSIDVVKKITGLLGTTVGYLQNLVTALLCTGRVIVSN